MPLDTLLDAPALGTLMMRGAALVLAAMIVTRLMRRASAASRHLVWTSALLMLLVLPVATVLVPAIPVPILPVSDAAVTSPAPVATGVDASDAAPREVSVPPAPPVVTSRFGDEAVPAIEAPGPDPEAAAAARRFELSISYAEAAIYVWMAVAGVLLAHLLISHVRLRSLARTAWRVRDDEWDDSLRAAVGALRISRPVTLLASGETTVPMTWGTRSPVVLLPAEALEWNAERRVAVLVHELAHVARFDALIQDVARIAAAVHWMNPLVWIAMRAMRAERERACDDLVLAAGLRPSVYAADLLDIARNVSYRPAAVAALAMARRNELEGRLLAILDPAAPRGRPGRRVRALLAAGALVLVVPLAALRPVPAASESTRAALPTAAAVNPAAGIASVGPDASDAANTSISSSFTTTSSSSRTTNDGRSAWAWAGATAGGSGTVPVDVSSAAESISVSVEADDETAAARISPARTAAEAADERETLIAVALAARRMKSDFEKAELLLEVAEHYVKDDSLRSVYLGTAGTISGSYERHRVLLGLLKKDQLAAGGVAQFLMVTAEIKGSHEKSVVLTKLMQVHPPTTPAVRDAFFAAAKTLGSHEHQTILLNATKQPWFDASSAIGVINSVKDLNTSYSKAEVLVAVARKGVLTNDATREAFLSAAETISTDSEYGRVMAAAAGRGRPRSP